MWDYSETVRVARGLGISIPSDIGYVTMEDECYTFAIPLPGTKKDAIAVTVVESSCGKKTYLQVAVSGKTIYKVEVRCLSVDLATISAAYEDGMLRITANRMANTSRPIPIL